MKTKQQKKQTVLGLAKKIPQSEMIAFTSFSQEAEGGLSVAEMSELRRLLRSQGGDYEVVKKNLIGVTLGQTKWSGKVPVEEFGGSLGLATTSGKVEADSLGIAKNLHNFSKSHPIFKVLGAIYQDQYLDSDRFKELALMPSREVLVSRFMSMLNYPLTGLLNVLQGTTKNLLLVLSNIKK